MIEPVARRLRRFGASASLAVAHAFRSRAEAGKLQPSVVLLAALLKLQFPTAIPQTKFNSGQDVVPYFEGWIRNRDGTFDMVFGYFNRNWQEELVIPPGPNNSVEPGGPDQGQPTYFPPRRQAWVYRVTVPANFGTKTLTWTITANGKTETTYGELLPVEEITERIIMTRGNLNPGEGDPNKPPSVAIVPIASAMVGAPVALTAEVSDDGLPKPRVPVRRPAAAPGSLDVTRIQAQANSSAAPRPRGLTVTWMQLRGPAKVTFDPSGAIAVAGGKASVAARFSRPGMYVLRATANDGALSTRSDVTINVGGGAATAAKPTIDNDRVTVWDVTAADPNGPRISGDSIWVSVSRPGEVALKPRGARGDAAALGGRAIVIDLKDKKVPPIGNTSGYPNAFPRPAVKKLLETERVIVWDYSWTPNQPTPMHFHDKDVVVVFAAEGALKSTTPDGQSTVNEFSIGTTRFNARDRVHTEVLARGAGRAIITELK